jgi:hypothetical protein
MATLKYPVAHAMRRISLVVDVTGVGTWRARLWLGTLLLRVAARVMRCGIRFDGITPEPPTTEDR